MDGRFDCAHKSGSHVDTLGSKGQGCSKPLAICEASRGNERNFQGLPSPTEKDEVRDIRLSDMARTLKAVDTQEIYAKLYGTLSVLDGGAFVEDNSVGSLQLLDDRAGTVSRRLDNPNSLVDNYLCVCAVVRWVYGREKSDVDAKRLVGHGLASSDFLS